MTYGDKHEFGAAVQALIGVSRHGQLQIGRIASDMASDNPQAYLWRARYHNLRYATHAEKDVKPVYVSFGRQLLQYNLSLYGTLREYRRARDNYVQHMDGWWDSPADQVRKSIMTEVGAVAFADTANLERLENWCRSNGYHAGSPREGLNVMISLADQPELLSLCYPLMCVDGYWATADKRIMKFERDPRGGVNITAVDGTVPWPEQQWYLVVKNEHLLD